MKAMHSLTSRIAPVPMSLLLAGAAAIFLLVTCTFGYLILDSRSQLLGESEKRFQARAEISAAMTDSLVRDRVRAATAGSGEDVRWANRGRAGACGCGP